MVIELVIDKYLFSLKFQILPYCFSELSQRLDFLLGNNLLELAVNFILLYTSIKNGRYLHKIDYQSQ